MRLDEVREPPSNPTFPNPLTSAPEPAITIDSSDPVPSPEPVKGKTVP